MSDIVTALVKAGVKVPAQNRRIWTYLKDFGPGDVKKIASMTKIGEGTVQATLTDMQKRKMIEKIERKDHKGGRLNNHYGALGRVFELLPLPKTGANPTPRVAMTNATPAFSPAALCDDYKLSELRTLYAYLKGMFK